MSEREDQSKNGSGLFDNLRKLINIVDELRDAGLQKIIKLPRIVVVGSQSSGKSTLLESIVGIDFLPRGSGVVTRRPLELRLVHVPASKSVILFVFYTSKFILKLNLLDDMIKPFAIFDVDKLKKYDDFDKVRDQINYLTDQVAGKRKKIVNDPITMTVYSNDVIDLTIIDLPGITRIALQDSDQSNDVEKVTKEMALSYITDERTIILCVIPANQDISNSDGLQLAREADKNGDRTIGVITKIDIMDKGTDAKRMILGKDIPLKLGYIGVKGRSQHDIQENKRVSKAIDEEADFFARHKIYSQMDQKYLGTKALTSKLSSVLFNHIRAILPSITREIRDKLKECEDQLHELGGELPEEKSEKLKLVWELISEYTENFKNHIKGRFDSRRSVIHSDFSGCAILKGQFRKLFSEYIQDDFKATHDLTDEQIQMAIKLYSGNYVPGFNTMGPFVSLLNPLLETMRSPMYKCLDSCHMYLQGIAGQIQKSVFKQFPILLTFVSSTTERVLQEERESAKIVLDDQLKAEQSFTFTNNLEYILMHSSFYPIGEDTPDHNQSYDGGVDLKAMTSGIRSGLRSKFRQLRRAILKPNKSYEDQEKDESSGGEVDNERSEGASESDEASNAGTDSEMSENEIISELKKDIQSAQEAQARQLRERIDSYFKIVVRNVRDSIPKAIGHFLIESSQKKLQYTLYNEIMRHEAAINSMQEPQEIAEERKAIRKNIEVLQKASLVIKRDPDLQPRYDDLQSKNPKGLDHEYESDYSDDS